MAILRLEKIDVQMRHHVITSTSKRERYLAVIIRGAIICDYEDEDDNDNDDDDDEQRE